MNDYEPHDITVNPSMSREVNELAAALSKAQSEIRVAPKNASNPFFNSKYADLQGVWDCCRDPLTQNGLAVTMTTETTDKGLRVTGVLLHSSGQWIKSSLTIRPVKDDPQAILSALTYGRRGLLAAMAGVVPGDDDDGNYASGRTPGAGAQEKPVQGHQEAQKALDDPTDVSAVGRLAKQTGKTREDITWWLADEGFIDVDEGGDPGPLTEEKLAWLLKDRKARVEEPFLRWRTWISILGAKKYPKNRRETLRQYFVDRDQIDPSKAVKGRFPWSNLHPEAVTLAAEHWDVVLSAYKEWANKE